MICLAGCTNKEGVSQKTEVTKEAEDQKPKIKETKVIKPSGDYAVYTYDPDGRLLTEVQYNQASELQKTIKYTYNEDGNLCELLVTDEKGESQILERKVYDAEGNLTEEYDGKNEEDLKLNFSYEYQNGKLIRDTMYHEDGSVFHLHEYTYDGDYMMRKEKKVMEKNPTSTEPGNTNTGTTEHFKK